MFLSCILCWCLGWLIVTRGSTARPWSHSCKIVLQELTHHPERMVDRVQEYPHLQAIQPGIEKVHSLINCSYGPVGALNERTRVGTDPNKPGVTSRSTLSLDIPDWRELKLRSNGTNLGYFRQRRDFHSGDETWNENTDNPLFSSYSPLELIKVSSRFLEYYSPPYPNIQLLGLMILSWSLNILETQTDPVRRGESKPWSTPPGRQSFYPRTRLETIPGDYWIETQPGETPELEPRTRGKPVFYNPNLKLRTGTESLPGAIRF